MRPAGNSTIGRRPARDAYAAADADVLPVDAQTTASAPAPAETLTATVIPRSLNDPVGLAPSTFSQTSHPSSSDRTLASTKGVFPSPRVITGSASSTGSHRRYRAIMPFLGREARAIEAISGTIHSPSTLITLVTSSTASS